MKQIMIVEDDKELRDELKTLLEKNEYKVLITDDFSDVAETVLESGADMVLLDINLPDSDGQSILRKLRKTSDVPVIMVTSKDTEMDEVICMSFGADDFIAKPYNPAILLLHIEAIFKRMSGKQSVDVLEYKELTVEVSRGVMRKDSQEIELTKNELGIISFMIKNKERIVTRDEIISYLWDSEEFVDDNTLTVNINRVRKKLSDIGLGDMIKTKRGQGYILE